MLRASKPPHCKGAACRQRENGDRIQRLPRDAAIRECTPNVTAYFAPRGIIARPSLPKYMIGSSTVQEHARV